jgi:hypothetical protein
MRIAQADDENVSCGIAHFHFSSANDGGKTFCSADRSYLFQIMPELTRRRDDPAALPPFDEGPVLINRSSRKGTSLETGGYRAVSNFQKAPPMAYTSEVARPTDHRNPPQASAVTPAEDVRTIALNQISWGAVFAGATIALVVQLILNMVGVGVGLSTIDVAAGNTPGAESR